MLSFFNQFSFVLLAGGGGALLLFGLWQWRSRSWLLRAGIAAWYVLAVLLVALLWRYPAAGVAATADVDAVIANGRPTLVMLYSNYCLGCLAALSAVREQMDDWAAAGINVLLLDIHAAPGRDLLERFAFVSTPTYLLFLPSGAEVYRSSQTPSLAQLQSLLVRF